MKPKITNIHSRARAVLVTALLCALALSCTVKYSYLKPNYQQQEKLRLKRIALAAEPFTDTNAKINELVLMILREFVSVQRDYIIYPLPKTARENPAVEDYCTANPKLNGIVMNRVRVLKKKNGDVRLGIQAVLYECEIKDGKVKDVIKVWETYGESSYESEDSGLKTAINSYTNRVGKEVRYLVAPVYLLIRAIYEDFPSPLLTDAEKLEKIDVME